MKLFVWDFHGVLEKGNDKAVWEITNLALEQMGFVRRMSKKENAKLCGSKWFQYFEFLLPEEKQKVHFKLQDKCLEIQTKHSEIVEKNIKPNDYALEVLETIRSKHRQILISNSHDKAIVWFIHKVRLEKYFDSTNTFTTNSHLNPDKINKKDILNNFLRKENNYEQIITIGDSPADLEMIEGFKGKKYLYSHPNKSFRDCEADYKINDLREILKEI